MRPVVALTRPVPRGVRRTGSEQRPGQRRRGAEAATEQHAAGQWVGLRIGG
jgi:hypothetical protein